MDADVSVETDADATESPSVAEDVSAESESPSVDRDGADAEGAEQSAAQAEANDEPEEWSKFLKSQGLDGKPFDGSAKSTIGKKLYKTFNDNSRFSKENEELKAKVAEYEQKLNSKPPEPEAEPESPADLKELDEQITALKADVTAFDERETFLLKEFGRLEREYASIDATLRTADELDKPRLEMERRQLNADRQAVTRELGNLPRAKAQLQRELKQTERERLIAERTHAESERARQEAEKQRATFMAEFPATVDNLIARFANELKLPDVADFRQFLNEDVSNSLTIALFRLGEAGINDFDVPALVKDHVERFGKRHGLIEKVKLNQASKGVQAARPVAVARPQVKNPEPAQRLSDEELLQQERAERVAKLNRGFQARLAGK